ncbi:MAG: ACP S-malonyltransferase [Gammaproteobacteria bacterium]|nr:ACP S-malonyltransferase [Gammaproteobacteria bacterium]
MTTDGLAFVFPGQGSQSVGMLSGLAENFPAVTGIFAEASARLDYDLLSLCLNGPEDKLNRTEYTQPALLTASYAIWRIWQDNGGARPGFLAGHSLGEYTALVCAEVLDFADAVELVADRGRIMQDAVPHGAGAMAAVSGLDDDTVIDVCAGAAQEEVVSAANFNFPGQVVIAGNAGAVERACDLAKKAGARRVTPLPVSVPAHCRLMLPAADRLQLRVNEIDFAPAAIPVVQNVDARARTDPGEIKEAMMLHMHQPVLWSKCIALMRDKGIGRIIECGPGRVLSGLIRRVDKNIACNGISDTASLDAALSM